MAADYVWISTDRKTDADILREIAAVDTPVVILSRDNPEMLGQAMSIIPPPQGAPPTIYLFELTAPKAAPCLEITRDLPFRLSFLITNPVVFGALALAGKKIPVWIDECYSQTLWESFLNLCQSGATILRKELPESLQNSSLGVIHRQSLRPMSSQPLSEEFREQIEEIGGVTLRAHSPDVIALRAGLFQWHDALHESHECSQSIEGEGKHRAGDFWHAIMHRREPDYGNSKYWFRRVGPHPIFPELGWRAEPVIAAAAPEWNARLLKNGWDPFAFVDFCEACAGGTNPQWTQCAEEIQEIEMLLLLASTYRDAAHQ